MAILDTFPYDFSNPLLLELHVALCAVYPTSKGAVFVAQKAGIGQATINSEQAALFVWKEILEAAATAQALPKIVRIVLDQNPSNPRAEFFSHLLADRTVVPAEPRGADGKPRFLTGSDEVFEPEALLFHDDLTLSTGRIGWLVDVLRVLERLAPAICRLECGFIGATGGGTGFRIGRDLVLTNWHVVEPPQLGKRATSVAASFRYEESSDGALVTDAAIPCAIVHAEPAHDWAVLRAVMPDSIPVIALDASVVPVEKEPAFVIQHPLGARKRIGYVRNEITSVTDTVVHYLTDTQMGSSGAPVFDSRGRLIALHHAGGRPQEVAGKLPLVKNEGVRVQCVLAGLAHANIHL